MTTPIQKIIEDLKKEGYLMDKLDVHYYLELEKQMIIETFRYAQILHSMGDEMRAEQFYYKKIKDDNK